MYPTLLWNHSPHVCFPTIPLSHCDTYPIRMCICLCHSCQSFRLDWERISSQIQHLLSASYSSISERSKRTALRPMCCLSLVGRGLSDICAGMTTLRLKPPIELAHPHGKGGSLSTLRVLCPYVASIAHQFRTSALCSLPPNRLHAPQLKVFACRSDVKD